MSMGMGGAGPWQTYRSFTRDRSVAQQRISRDTVRRILRFAQPYRRLIVWFLLTLVVGSLLVVAQPLLFRRIVDQGITPGDRGVVTVSAILVLVLALADAAIGLVGRWYSARIGEGLIYDLRTQVFGHVQSQPLAFFTRTQTGALISRLNSDVIGAQQAFTSTLGGVVGNLIQVVVVLVAMVALSWPITLISLVLLPLFLLPARWMGRRLQAQTRQQMELNADMSSMMTERFNVSGALLVKLFGRPAEEQRAFSGRAALVRDIGVQIAMSNRYFFTALTLVASVATAIAYGVGGNLVIGGSLTIGTLLAITALLARLYGPLTALSNVRVDVMTALVSFERVFEVLDLRPLVAEAPDARQITPGPTAIELRDVHFTYPGADEVSLASLESVARPEARGRGEPVLTGISFRVEPGQMVALVGPSGAGKSTITALVTRLYDVTSGAVLVGGVDVREATLASLSDRIGVVTQDAHMFHDTIRGNLQYARPGATDEELLAACRDAQIGELVAALPEGLDTVVGERGYRLSGGEKQRLAIARLLLKAPEVVVLDEATAHLDSESEAAVQRALATALAGRTSLVVAHRLSTIRAADEILVVDGGQVVQRGTHEQLLAAGGLYADLSRKQFGMEPAQETEPEPVAS
ncbi:MAG: ABC transporter ATP-binding protein/permease [Candidatus Nanopelagicales bacterium]|jgi:ATP-binding cassette subfamily B protein|nr:ABC transporter ATP-binding protein/permease [Candidatus Nanopelagicales bacterium]